MPPGSKFFYFYEVSAKNRLSHSLGSWRSPQENPGSATDEFTKRCNLHFNTGLAIDLFFTLGLSIVYVQWCKNSKYAGLHH